MAEPSSIARAARLQEAGLLLVVLLLGALIALSADTIVVRGQPANAFLRWDNLLANVATPMSWMAIMALGATAVIVSGGIDISVGSVFGLSALGTAAVLQRMPADAALPAALGVAAAVALGIGLLCGLINGARGIGLVSVETKTLPTLGRQLPDSFTEDFVGWRWSFGAGPAAGFVQPVPMLVMLGGVVFFWLLLAHTVTGREIYAVGGNETAARYAGLRVGAVKLRVYALSGLCAGLAG